MEKFLQLVPGHGPLRSQVTGKLIGVKDLPHGGLKTWKLSGKLGMLFGGFGEVQQLLADQIIQCVFQAESPPNGAGGLALLSPNLVILHEGDYTATMSWPPSAAMQQCIWRTTPIPWGLRPKERTLLLQLPRPVRVRE